MSDIKLLTKRQKSVLDFINNELSTKGIVPSMREISDHFGFSSTNAAYQHLFALVQKGYIRRSERGSSRYIELLKAPDDMNKSGAGKLIVIGEANYNNPYSGFINNYGYIDLAKLVNGYNEDFFAYRAEKNYEEYSIRSGDLLIVESAETKDSKGIFLVINTDGYALESKIRKSSKLIGKVTSIIRQY